MEDDEITHWLELPADMGFVPFSELAHLIAKARFPVAPEDEEFDFAYGAARVNLDEELPKAVAADLLKVRDPLTHGPHTFPHGFALQSAVVKVSDLRAYLADRGMGVRVTEAGNGPTHWTIGNAAAAIAAQQGWHGHARDTSKEQMMQAARDGTLTVRHPHTDIPYRPDPVRDFYERVTPADVNAWLTQYGTGYLFPPAAGAESPAVPTAQPEPAKNPEPPPLTTSDIASAFAGLRWSEVEWKKPLGDKPKWLAACVSIPGRRGSIETRWNPVCIGGALIFSGHVQARSVRARFQTNHLLLHWFDAWKTYEADNLDTP
jgi:hypothetical protein